MEHQQVISFDDVPVFLGCSTKKRDEDIFVSYKALQCIRCGLITTDANLDELSYAELHSEAIGGIWLRHHDTFAAFCMRKMAYLLKQPSVLEIGPSSNPIVRRIQCEFDSVCYCDMLTELPFALIHNEVYVQARFPEHMDSNRFEIIIASHVFEHADNLNKFLKGALDRLEKNGSVLISIPNFQYWIENKYWNAITPEHNNYPMEEHLRYLAQLCRVEIEIEYFENHSVFAHFKKTEWTDRPFIIFNPSAAEKILLQWVESLQHSIELAENALISAAQKHHFDAVLLAGASHLSQYPILMSHQITQRVTNVIDNSDYKNGKRLYGTKVIVKEFEIIADYIQPAVVIFASPYQNEMSKQVKALNPRAIVLTC